MRDTDSSVYYRKVHYRKECKLDPQLHQSEQNAGTTIFTPGRTLKQTFYKSRPLDRSKCVLGNPERCTICPIIGNGTCSIRGAVYQISCRLCNSDIKYQGETDRPLHHRLKEHVRAAAKVVYITRSTAHLDMTFEITKTIS